MRNRLRARHRRMHALRADYKRQRQVPRALMPRGFLRALFREPLVCRGEIPPWLQTDRSRVTICTCRCFIRVSHKVSNAIWLIIITASWFKVRPTEIKFTFIISNSISYPVQHINIYLSAGRYPVACTPGYIKPKVDGLALCKSYWTDYFRQ